MRFKLGGVMLYGLIAVGVLGGCGKNPAAPSNVQGSPDQMSVTATLDSVSAFTSDDVYGGSSQASMSAARPGAGPSRVQAALAPLHFWRTFRSVTSTLGFSFSDPDTSGRPLLVHVTIDRALRGDFHIIPGTPGDTTLPDTTHIVDKPIVENWTRHLLFHRVSKDTLGFEWRLVAASGVRVARPGNTVHIVSLHLQAMSGADTVITDPSALFTLRQLPRYTAGDSVTVTVTSERNDDVAVMYLFDRRTIMHNNGDNTYTLGFNVGSFTEWHDLGINVFTHGTLFDDMMPYDSETWILPFTTNTNPVADYLP